MIPLICLASWDCNFHNKKFYDNYGTLEVGNPAHIFVFYKLYFCYVAIPLKDLVTFAWRNNPVSNFNTALMLSCGVPFFFSFFRKYHSMHNCTTLPYIKTPWEWGLYGPISPSFGQLVFHFWTWTSSMKKYKSRMALWTKLISFYISLSFLQAIKLNYFPRNTFITDYQQIKSKK